MVFHWSLSHFKSYYVSRTLYSILANHNNDVVWIFSTCPQVSKSFRPFDKLIWIVPSAWITIAITTTFMFHRFIGSLGKSAYLFLFSLSFNFILVRWDDKVLYSASSLFSSSWQSLDVVVWPKSFDILENFVLLILQNRFLVVHIPLVRIVKFQFLAQFPVDHLFHFVVSIS